MKKVLKWILGMSALTTFFFEFDDSGISLFTESCSRKNGNSISACYVTDNSGSKSISLE